MNLTQEDIKIHLAGMEQKGNLDSPFPSNFKKSSYFPSNSISRFKMAIRGLPFIGVESKGQMEIINQQDWNYIHAIEALEDTGSPIPDKIQLPSFPTDASFYMHVGAKSNEILGIDYEKYDIGEENKKWYRFGKEHKIAFNKETIRGDLYKIFNKTSDGNVSWVLEGFSKYLSGQKVEKADSWVYYGYLCAEKGLDLKKVLKNAADRNGAPELIHEVYVKQAEIIATKFPNVKITRELSYYRPTSATKEEFTKNFPISKSALLSVTDEDREYILRYVHRLKGNCQTCGTDKEFKLPSGITTDNVYFQLRMAHTALVINEAIEEVPENIKYIAKLLFDMGIKDLTSVKGPSSFQDVIDKQEIFQTNHSCSRFFSCGLNRVLDSKYEKNMDKGNYFEQVTYMDLALKSVKEKFSYEELEKILKEGWKGVAKEIYGDNMPSASLKDFILENSNNSDWKKEWDKGWKEGLKNYTQDKNWTWSSIASLSTFEIAKKLAESGNIYLNKDIIEKLAALYGINVNNNMLSGHLHRLACASTNLPDEDYSQFVIKSKRNLYRWAKYTYKNYGNVSNDLNGIFTVSVDDDAVWLLYGFRNAIDGSTYGPEKSGVEGDALTRLTEIWEFGKKFGNSDFETTKKVVDLMNQWYNKSNKTETFMQFLKKNGGLEMKMASNETGSVKKWASEKVSAWAPSVKSGSLKGLVRSLKTQVKKIIINSLSEQKKNKTYKAAVADFLEGPFGDLIVYALVSETIEPIGNFVRLPKNMTSFVSATCREEIAAYISENLANGAADLAGGLLTELKKSVEGAASGFQALQAATKEEEVPDNVISFSDSVKEAELVSSS